MYVKMSTGQHADNRATQSARTWGLAGSACVFVGTEPVHVPYSVLTAEGEAGSLRGLGPHPEVKDTWGRPTGCR